MLIEVREERSVWRKIFEGAHIWTMRRYCTTVSTQNGSHGTALHHAVCSGSLDAVKALVEAGADLTRRVTVYDGTPLSWAKYGAQLQKNGDDSTAKEFTQIIEYVREQGGQE
jgi:hypothetical protein